MLHDSSASKSVNSIVACSLSISNNDDEHCVADTNGKSNVKNNGVPMGVESNGNRNQTIAENTSKSNTCNNHRRRIPNRSAQKEPAPQMHTGDAQRTTDCGHKVPTTVTVPPNQYPAKSPHAESTQQPVSVSKKQCVSSVCKNKDLPTKGMSILQQLIKEEESFGRDRSCPELKLDPFKISFKRAKVSEQEADREGEVSPHAEVSACQPSFPPPWGSKTPQQLHVLRQVFSNTRWPSSQQYEDLSIQTGLPKSEVVRWFSDSRYSHKNGQLRWLETYQRPSADPE
uniref:Homeobox domain-containing protein n=1 Tax=Tetraodon nigroviridis TaxID=99883 RepID=H3BVU6_TETNG